MQSFHSFRLVKLILLYSGLITYPCAVFSSSTKTHSIEQAKEYLYSNIDSAVYIAEIHLKEAQQTNNIKQKSQAYLILARASLNKGDYLISLEYFNLINILLQELKDHQIEAELNALYALLNLKIQKFDKAAEYGFKALDYHQKTGNKIKLAELYNFFGGLYMSTNDIPKTIAYVNKSLAINQELQLTPQLASNYSNLGVCYSNLGKQDSAILLINKAIEINLNSNNKQWLAINYHGLANIYFRQDQLALATRFYKQSITEYRQLKDVVGEVQVKIKLAQIDYKNHQNQSSIEKLKACLELTKQKNIVEEQLNILVALHKIAEENQEYELALDYMHEYTSIKEQQNKAQTNSLLNIIDVQQDFEKKRAQLHTENEAIKIKSTRKNAFILILIGLIALIVFASFLYYKWNRLEGASAQLEQDRLQKELLLKNKELTLSIIHKAKNNEEKLHIVKRLNSIQKEVGFKHKAPIASIIKELKKDKEDGIWEEFELRFKNVHQGFYDRLKQKGPELTPAEIKICAFLKLNMTSKEIASILYKSTSTIEVDRARIRKKMGLTNQKTNLVSFIMEI